MFTTTVDLMPTTKPRIQVTLSPDTYRALADLSKVSRLSMSRICSDMIEEFVPIMERVRGMMEAAAQLSDEARAMLRRDFGEALKVAERAQGMAFGSLAEAEAAVKRAGGGARSAPRRPAGRGRRPPSE